MCLHSRGGRHSSVGLTSVLHGRIEPSKPSRGPGKKGCITLNVDPFRPWRNGQKPPEMRKLRLHQVVEKAQRGYLWKGWLVRLCWVCNSSRVKGMEEKNNFALQRAFQGALQPQSLCLMLVNT